MRLLKYMLVGILFEMFRFQSFHMYGIIGVAVVLGAIMHWWIKKGGLKNAEGQIIEFADKPNTYKASIFGGTLFGLGWAMTGACPGPLYTLVGHGLWNQ